MINQITQIRLPGPDGEYITVALTDWSHRPLYSAADLLSGFTDTEIFTFNYTDGDPVAASGNITTPRTASKMDTNITIASEMASVEEFLCYGIAVEIYQVTGSAAGISDQTAPLPGAPIPRAGVVSTLHRRIILELDVSEKDFLVAPLGFFPAGFGPALTMFAGVGAGAVVRTAANNGDPGHHAEQSLQIPVHIGGTEDYGVSLLNPSGEAVTFPTDAAASDATAYICLRILLNGLHKRPLG